MSTARTARTALVLLIVAFVIFVVAIVAHVTASASITTTGFWDLTRDELDPVVALWLLARCAIGVGGVLASLAIVMLARDARDDTARPWARASVASAVVGIVVSVVYLVGYVATARFETPTLGAEPLFWVAYAAGFASTFAVALALTLLAVAWRREGILRGRTLVVVSIVVTVVAVVLPPAVVGVLGLVFAIVRLRSAAGSHGARALS